MFFKIIFFSIAFFLFVDHTHIHNQNKNIKISR